MKKPIDKIFPHPKNPRFIRNEKYLEQKKSITETPEMMTLRPVIIDENDIILGGHQRWRACKELGWKDIPVMPYTRDMHLKSESWTIYGKSYEAVGAEVAIKDNTHYGQFDYDILANEWDDFPLVDWGLDLYLNNDKNDLNISEEWTDMPEFDQQDLRPYRQMIISFKSEKDIKDFAQLIKQTITDKTKSVWYPEVKNEIQFDKTYE